MNLDEPWLQRVNCRISNSAVVLPRVVTRSIGDREKISKSLGVCGRCDQLNVI